VDKSRFIFNVLIALAVIVLFILHFAQVKKPYGLVKKESAPVGNIVSSGSNITIAYVNTDSILASYTLYNEMKNELESQQSNAEYQYEKKMKEFEKTFGL